MKKHKLGGQGLEVSALGLGCMGMSDFYGTADEKESLATFDRALELGVNFFDTADMYGPHTNERLVGKALRSRRDDVIIATKFGIERGEDGQFIGTNGRPDYVRKACDASLERLGVDHIDLYYQHRVDPNVSIDDTVGAMAELVAAGKVRYLGLSEAGAKTIRRANKVHPISALQSEYSLWSRDIEPDVIPTIRELGIGLVSYSPLGRGFLTGRIKSVDDLDADDWRRNMPRFSEENFPKNLELVERVNDIAASKNVTAGQIALAWVRAKGADIVPIPGTTKRKHLEELVAAVDVELTPSDMASLEEVVPPEAFLGTRYPAMGMRAINL